MRRLLFLLAAVFALSVSAGAVYDSANINNEEEGPSADMIDDISVSMSLGVTRVTDGFVRIYDVGSFDSDTGQYILDDVFAHYGLDINASDFAARAWDCFRVDKMACRMYGNLGDNNRAEFRNLAPAVYLIAGDDFWHDGIKYRPAPALVYIDDTPAGMRLNLDCAPVPYDGTNINEIFSSSISVSEDSYADDGNVSPAEDAVQSVLLDAIVVFVVCLCVYLILRWFVCSWKEETLS